MLGAYGWAFIKPIRKLYYNMTITFVSVIAALGYRGIEALALGGKPACKARLGCDRARQRQFRSCSAMSSGTVVVSWLSRCIYRLKRYDDIEVAGAEGGPPGPPVAAPYFLSEPTRQSSLATSSPSA